MLLYNMGMLTEVDGRVIKSKLESMYQQYHFVRKFLIKLIETWVEFESMRIENNFNLGC